MSESNVLNKSSSSEDSYSFLVFDDSGQNPKDVALAAKFWKQFELEPQIESRLVSKDNISQSSRKDSAKIARRHSEHRVRSQPAARVSDSRQGSATGISRAQTIASGLKSDEHSNLRGIRSSTRLQHSATGSLAESRENSATSKNANIAEMVKQLKKSSKFSQAREIGGLGEMMGADMRELDGDISDHEACTIESEMRQLDLFDESISKAQTTNAVPSF